MGAKPALVILQRTFGAKTAQAWQLFSAAPFGVAVKALLQVLARRSKCCNNEKAPRVGSSGAAPVRNGWAVQNRHPPGAHSVRHGWA